MSRYAILEDNMEKLEKRLAAIANKCKKYGCEFSYTRVGEEYREVILENLEKITAKFIIIEVEGVAKVEGWRFVATIEHTPNGNIVHPYGADDLDIPPRYYTTDPVCEHCNTKRRRSDTYLIYNEGSSEWKQVGGSCLHSFTGGLNADLVARYISYLTSLAEGEGPTPGIRYTPHYPVVDILLYASECVAKFGYVKSGGCYSTAERCLEYYLLDNDRLFTYPGRVAEIRRDMENCQFCIDDHREFVDNAIQWARGIDSDNSYMHNLKTICLSEYVSRRNLGILVSLVFTYHRHLGHVAEQKRQAKVAEQCPSKHIGEIGDRIEIHSTAECITCTETIYGTSYMYKLVDNDGNIFIWFTGKYLDPDTLYRVIGTVKGHDEFRGCKQTHITRCRVSVISEEDAASA